MKNGRSLKPVIPLSWKARFKKAHVLDTADSPFSGQRHGVTDISTSNYRLIKLRR
jgi:hypothetical protein